MPRLVDRIAAWWLNDYLQMRLDEKVIPLQEQMLDLEQEFLALRLTLARNQQTASIAPKSDLVLGVDPHLGRL